MSKIMLGLLGKINFGRQIGCKSVDGTIVSCVPFARKQWKPTTTSMSIVCPLSLHRDDLGIANGMNWTPRDTSETIDRPKYQRIVVLVGRRLHSSKKGFGLPHLAHHLGDKERAQCKGFSKISPYRL
jgi:hypothetical protein